MIVEISSAIGISIVCVYIYKKCKKRYELNKLRSSVHPFYKKRSSKLFFIE